MIEHVTHEFKSIKKYTMGVEKNTDDTWESRVYKPATSGLMCQAYEGGFKYYSKPQYEEFGDIAILTSYGLDN